MAAGAAAPPQCRAQDAAPENTPQTSARAAYARGVEAFSQQRFEQAHEHFALAEQLYPSPNIELMLGRTLAELGRLSAARRQLKKAQAGASSPKYAGTAVLAEQELREVESRLGHLEIIISDARGDESVRINGELLEAGAWRTPLQLDPGEIEVELSRSGAPPTTEKVHLEAGATAQLTLRATPPAPQRELPSNTPRKPISSHTRAITSDLPRSHKLRGVSYALGGVAAASLVGFGIFGAFSHARYSKLEELCPDPTTCDPSYRWLATSGRTYQTLANVTLVASGVMLTGAVTTWILSLDGQSDIAVGANSVQLRGRF
jgi:hypothetical protein